MQILYIKHFTIILMRLTQKYMIIIIKKNTAQK